MSFSMKKRSTKSESNKIKVTVATLIPMKAKEKTGTSDVEACAKRPVRRLMNSF